MTDRTIASSTRCAVSFDGLLSALDRTRARVRDVLRKSALEYDKWLDEKAEEAEIAAKHLAASEAMSNAAARGLMCVPQHLNAAFIASLVTEAEAAARLQTPMTTLALSCLLDSIKIWQEQVCVSASLLSGKGLTRFVKGAAGKAHNVVFVHPRVSDGTLAEYVTPDDVRVILKGDDTGTIPAVDVKVSWHPCCELGSPLYGKLMVAYSVDGPCADDLTLTLSISGSIIYNGSLASVPVGYDASAETRLVASYFQDKLPRKNGLAVTNDGNVLAVAFPAMDQVHLFQMLPSFKQVRIIGKRGTGPAEFMEPRRICFTDEDTLLVCDYLNDRIQQLTLTGDMLSSFLVTVGRPSSIAIHPDNDIVAVGNGYGSIELFSLPTGTLIHSFGCWGAGAGDIGGVATGIRFTPDGACLLVAEYNNHRLSLFTASGVFIKHIGVGLLGGEAINDVTFGAGDEIIVADHKNNCVRVFSSDGNILIKSWGSAGTTDGLFVQPWTLAVSGSLLYVVDETRVQVFE